MATQYMIPIISHSENEDGKKNQWLPQGLGEGDKQKEAQGCLGQCIDSVWYCNGGYMSFICGNPQNVQH